MTYPAFMYNTDKNIYSTKSIRYKRFMQSRLYTYTTKSMYKYIKCPCECPYTTKSTSGGLKC